MAKVGDRLGDILVDSGTLSETELNEALAIQETDKAGRLLGEVLVEEGFVSEEDLGQALYQQTGYEYIQLADQEIDNEALAMIDEGFARRKIVVPIQKIDNRLVVAIGNPSHLTIINDLQTQTGMEIEPRVSTPSEVRQTIEAAYNQMRLKGLKVREERLPPLTQVTDDMPVSQIVEAIINEALRLEASDIHIEPLPDQLRVRYRIDGILYEVARFSMDIHNELVARVRITAGLDIPIEKGTPQDGSTRLGEYELRVSIFPFIYGESIVLRVLNPLIPFTIEELGLQGETLRQYQKLIHNPSGLILATGPTGSGKTTTLTASLKAISSPKLNIITIEDPPEYRIDENVKQAPVNRRKKIDFANALRYIFRQDPDVIMVGEIRDEETAQMATRASLTGHLVFSTLHTNSALGAVSRLLNMGVEPYLLAATLKGVVAQRLVRKLCSNCKQPVQPEEWEQMVFEDYLYEATEPVETVYRPVGCPRCSNRGYRGRTGIFELFVVDEWTRDMIVEGASDEEIAREAVKGGMATLIEDGLRKVISGITSLEEVLWHKESSIRI
ncbi:MAG: GspE/PulE family protein [Candidatus Bipolaricaulia bacterium]